MEQLPSDQHLLELRQIVQENTPLSERFATQRQFEEMLSRASGNIVRLPKPFDHNLLSVGHSLAEDMALQPVESTMFEFMFLREIQKQDPRINVVPNDDDLEDEFLNDIDNERIPDQFKFRVIRCWRQLKKEGQTLAMLMTGEDFSPEQARQQLILSQEAISNRRVPGISMSYEYRFEQQEPNSEQLAEITTVRVPEPLSDEQLTQIHQDYLEILSTLDNEAAEDFEQLLSGGQPSEDMIHAVIGQRLSQSTIDESFGQVALRLGKAFGLSQFETAIFDLYFATQSMEFFWDRVIELSDQATGTDKAGREVYKDSSTNTRLLRDRQVDEMVMLLLLKSPESKEVELRARMGQVIEASLDLAEVFYSKELDIPASRELITNCLNKIKGSEILS